MFIPYSNIGGFKLHMGVPHYEFLVLLRPHLGLRMEVNMQTTTRCVTVCLAALIVIIVLVPNPVDTLSLTRPPINAPPDSCNPFERCSSTVTAQNSSKSGGVLPSSARTTWIQVGNGGPDRTFGLVYDTSIGTLIALNFTEIEYDPVWTWSYNGSWHHLPVSLNWSAEPIACAGPHTAGYVAYDSVDQYVLGLFMFETNSCVQIFQGGEWRAAPIPNEILRPEAMSFDPSLDRFVVFGAQMTWVFSNSTWTNVTSEAVQPEPSVDPAFAWDPADNYTLLFGGGEPSTGIGINYTWEFKGNVWTNISDESPSHPATNLYWFDHNNSTPATPDDSAATFDAADGYLVLLHEQLRGFPTTTWTFADGVWTNVSWRLPVEPPYGSGFMAYNSNNSTAVFWSLDVGLWTWAHYPSLQVIGLHDVPHIVDLGMDSQFSVVMSGGLFPFSFNYSDIPPGCIQYNGPGFYCQPSTAGQFMVTVNVTDWVGEYGTASAELNVSRSLHLISLSLSPNLIDEGQRLTLETSVQDGTPPYTYSYYGLPLGCQDLNLSDLKCYPKAFGDFAIRVTVADLAGDFQSQSVSLSVLPPVGLELQVINPVNVILGQNATISVNGYGGTGVYTYTYSGLPPNCTTENRSTILCTPTGPGDYSIVVNVTDTLGESAGVNLSFLVTSPPNAPHTSPSNVELELLGMVLIAGATIAICLCVWSWKGRNRGHSIPRLVGCIGPAKDEAPRHHS
jgi:hypothetical protein